MVLKVAAVQAAPVFLDLDATVDKTVGLIAEAAGGGAAVVAFPEGFVPGHPGWVELLPLDDRAMQLNERLFKNAVEVPGTAVDTIAQACGEHGIAAVVGVCERRPRTTGTLFNTQVFIDDSGTIACKHQKFVPTIGERIVHGPGTTGTANDMRVGDVTVTGLICGENSNPLAQYSTACAYPTLHVASWPQHFSPDLAMQPVIELVGPALAYTLKAFVINSVTTISDRMEEAYGTDTTRTFLSDAASGGRASIVGPGGQTLAEADGDEEQLVFADIDPDAVIAPKFVHDTAGHYNRPELFAHLFPEPRPS